MLSIFSKWVKSGFTQICVICCVTGGDVDNEDKLCPFRFGTLPVRSVSGASHTLTTAMLTVSSLCVCLIVTDVVPSARYSLLTKRSDLMCRRLPFPVKCWRRDDIVPEALPFLWGEWKARRLRLISQAGVIGACVQEFAKGSVMCRLPRAGG